MPRDNHDRTIMVRLTPGAVYVDYRLEVDETRATLDLPKNELDRVARPEDFYPTFVRYVAPILADSLVGRLNGKLLVFTCTRRRFEVLDHLRCDFQFRAAWAPVAGKENTFDLRDNNYEEDDFSLLRLALTAADGVVLRNVQAPDAALLARPPLERKPGDMARLRRVSAVVLLGPQTARGVYKPAFAPDPEPSRRPPRRRDRPALAKAPPRDRSAAVARSGPPAETATGGEPEVEVSGAAPPSGPSKLLHLLFDTRHGLWVLLLLAAGFGAVHALTPGHGKTLVAAYLIGERGTVWHALLLGVVTTLTHTAAVLILAVLLPLFFPHHMRGSVQASLGLVGGLLVAGLGFWLLVCRVTGRADHVHLSGGHHHHHGHGHHHHTHDGPFAHHHHHAEAVPVLPATAETAVATAPPVEAARQDGARPGLWGLVVLGVSGGIVPCWDAIALLLVAISKQRLALALPLLLAFSAGLASVLIAIGIGVVCARNVADARWGRTERLRPLLKALPLISAALVMGLGLWLCYDSVQAGLHGTAQAGE